MLQVERNIAKLSNVVDKHDYKQWEILLLENSGLIVNVDPFWKTAKFLDL